MTISKTGKCRTIVTLSQQSYTKGTYVRFGGDYHNVQVVLQYSWLGRAK